jgi:hypothetical protein
MEESGGSPWVSDQGPEAPGPLLGGREGQVWSGAHSHSSLEVLDHTPGQVARLGSRGGRARMQH